MERSDNENKSNKQNKYIIIVAVAIAIIFIILILLWSIAFCLRNTKLWKNLISSRFDRIVPKFHVPRIKEYEKDPEEWRLLIYNDDNNNGNNDNNGNNNNNNGNNNNGNNNYNKILPYIYISGGPHNRNLLICHGATDELEYCYYDYVKISKRDNINIICLEYPGFGTRKKLNNDKITENSILLEYPKEVKYLIEEHLKIPWQNIILLGQCFGAPIAITIASLPSVRHRLKALYLTKTMPNLKHVAADASKLLEIITPDFLNLDESITDNVLTKIVMIHPEFDPVCKLKRVAQLYEKFKNSVEKKFCVYKGERHKMKMYDALNLFPLVY